MNSDSTIELVSIALDTALMRQTAIANNIANVNTPAYQTIEVNFEEQLHNVHDNDLESLESVHPFYQMASEQSTVDEQMVLNVKNMTHYRALIKGLNQKLSIMKLALQGVNA